jgi:hypothetical protein
MRTQAIALTICATLMSGCGTEIRHTSTLMQHTNAILVSGVGDIVLQLSKSKSLPNAFGKADIFGRTTPTGLVVVQYAGVENGNPVFYRSTNIIETGATTMNSTGLWVPNVRTTNVSGTTHGTSRHGTFSGTATTTEQTYIPPKGSHAQQVLLGTLKMILNLSDSNILLVEGRKIQVLKANASMVEYKILE